MSKRLKTECHVINTTQRKIPKPKQAALLRLLPNPDTHPPEMYESVQEMKQTALA